jgi:hypothetical protein
VPRSDEERIDEEIDLANAKNEKRKKSGSMGFRQSLRNLRAVKRAGVKADPEFIQKAGIAYRRIAQSKIAKQEIKKAKGFGSHLETEWEPSRSGRSRAAGMPDILFGNVPKRSKKKSKTKQKSKDPFPDFDTLF